MIRRFFGMVVFTATILLASFGQDVFGRKDIAALVQKVGKEAPARTETAWKKTDIFLAALSAKHQ